VPEWGEQRIAGMVENRREWVISRQRRWGSPITLLYATREGERVAIYPWQDSPEEQLKFFGRVVAIFRTEGADAWYARPASDFLPEEADLRGFARSDFLPESDILDVWFDSGVSHLAVLRKGEWPELTRPPGSGEPPADLYVEGHDQYRGWFHSSLLVALGAKDAAPYREVVTHGWVLDAEGRVYTFGAAKHYGDRRDPAQPRVAVAPTPTGRGYWQLSAWGGVFDFGDAEYTGMRTTALRFRCE
jgi:isoleucyl-tRNA synthetase